MILFLDDDSRSLEPYREALEAEGYDVIIAKSTDEAHDIIQTERDTLDVVVWDMMMPPGRIFEHEDTDMGLRTGEMFYKKLREVHPQIPTMLFTNRNVDHLQGDFKSDPRTSVFMKEDLLPSELIGAIRELVRKVEELNRNG